MCRKARAKAAFQKARLDQTSEWEQFGSPKFSGRIGFTYSSFAKSDRLEEVGLERRSSDESAVDVLLREESPAFSAFIDPPYWMIISSAAAFAVHVGDDFAGRRRIASASSGVAVLPVPIAQTGS